MWESVVMVVVVGVLWMAGMATIAWVMGRTSRDLATAFQRVLSPGVEGEPLPPTREMEQQMELTTDLPWEFWEAEAEIPAADPFQNG